MLQTLHLVFSVSRLANSQALLVNLSDRGRGEVSPVLKVSLEPLSAESVKLVEMLLVLTAVTNPFALTVIGLNYLCEMFGFSRCLYFDCCCVSCSNVRRFLPGHFLCQDRDFLLSSAVE